MKKTLISKISRPDRVILAVREFIAKEMSEKYITLITFDINLFLNDSSPTTTLIFLLPGTDPLNILIIKQSLKTKHLKPYFWDKDKLSFNICLVLMIIIEKMDFCMYIQKSAIK